MNKRRAFGFTIVEILIVVIILGILAAIVTIGFSNVRRAAMLRSMQSDLKNVVTSMETKFQKTAVYPTSLPTDIKPSEGIVLSLVTSGAEPYYDIVSEVQNGVLFAGICADLVAEGLGNGVNQGGDTEDYITGCGNWNHDSMQFTGWVTKKWLIPVNSATLLNYAQTFTSNDSWNKAAHEKVVKNFYTEVVERFERQGGHFPITSFWDYWATPQNGGVIAVPLPTNPKSTPYYCAEAKVDDSRGVVWHVTEKGKLTPGSCN